MSRRAQTDAGFMLVELLIVMVMFVVILGATLVLFNTFERGTRDTERLTEQIEVARDTNDKVSRQLRNLAKPTSAVLSPIQLADKYDVIFQTSDPTRTWVRYCLDTTGSGASPDNAKLWSAESTSATLPDGAGGACPGTGWAAGSTRVVARNIVNTVGGQDRPVFSYSCATGAPASCGTAAATGEYPRIIGVALNLFVDTNVSRVPLAEQVSTSVYLRNQNEKPTATFTWLPSSGKVFLNASSSTDPEGRTLRYYWFSGSTVPSSFSCEAGPAATPPYLSGVTVSFPGTGPAPPSGSTTGITLVVCDPGDLKDTQTKTVTFP